VSSRRSGGRAVEPWTTLGLIHSCRGTDMTAILSLDALRFIKICDQDMRKMVEYSGCEGTNVIN